MGAICKKCGAELSENAKFCGKCGAQADINWNLKEEAGAKAASSGKKKKWLGILAAVAVVLIVLAALGSSSSKDPVRELKDIVFESYGNKEFGEAVRESIPEAKWESAELGENRYEVTVYGFCPELFSNIQLGFDVNYSGELVYAKLVYVYIDEEYFDDALSTAIVMEAIYQ